MTKVRVRFAPSPTGPLHIGGVRTALFNYLFAKKNNGSFVLRIEDTDQNRLVEGAENYIIEALEWCGMKPDEGPSIGGYLGPYKQSERKIIYKEHIQKLIDNNTAYYAFDSAESLENERIVHEKEGKKFTYNGHNRTKGRLVNSLVLSEKQTEEKIRSGEKYVVRFKMPQNRTIILEDMVRGVIKIESRNLDDKILFKSDGMPTYHLANVVDDHLMEISHVIRGEEWLPSMALHSLIYEAFGWKRPQFAHLPLILKPKGKGKLSKRDGDKLGFPVFPLSWLDQKSGTIAKGFKESGYLKEALMNFLVLLGWNPGTEQEIFSIEEVIKVFSLEKVQKAGARFDPEKLNWFNQQYIQSSSSKKIAEYFIKTKKLEKEKKDFIETAINLVKDRAEKMTDLWSLCGFFFERPTSFDEAGLKRAWKEDSSGILEKVGLKLEEIEKFTPEEIKKQITLWAKSNNIGLGKIMMPLRLAMVGDLKGPDVFEILHLLGKEESKRRIKTLIERD